MSYNSPPAWIHGQRTAGAVSATSTLVTVPAGYTARLYSLNVSLRNGYAAADNIKFLLKYGSSLNYPLQVVLNAYQPSWVINWPFPGLRWSGDVQCLYQGTVNTFEINLFYYLDS